MISFPPIILALPFLVYLLIHFFLMAVNIKHVFNTGTATFLSFIATAIFFVYSLIVVSLTWNLAGPFLLQPVATIDLGSIFTPPGF